MICHFAVVRIVGANQIRHMRAICGVPRVRDRYWTINPDLVTCEDCRKWLVKGPDKEIRHGEDDG